MSKFNITKVSIQNFRSIQDEIVLEIKPGLFCIEGINLDEPNATNGVGKSTLISAIFWALTGNTLTNEVLADDVVNSKINKDCRVTVYISSDNEDIKITRTRKDSIDGNNLFLIINDKDLSCHKIVETQQRINDIIKIPFDLLQSTIILTQDIKSAFSKLTPQQRIQTLESIRDYSIWDKVRDEANKDIKDYNKEIQEKQLQASNIQGSINTYTSMIESEKNNKTNFINNTKIETITGLLNNTKINKQKEIDQLAILNKQLTELKSKTFPDTTETQNKLNAIKDEANNLKTENQKLEYEIKSIEKEIKLINDWFIKDKCPTCGKPLDRTEEEKINKQNKLNEYTKIIENYKNEIVKKEELINNKRKEWSELNQTYQNLDKDRVNTLKQITDLQYSYNAVNANINSCEKNILMYQNKLNTYEDTINKIEINIKNYTNEIVKLNNNIENLQKEISEIEYKRKLSDYYYKLLSAKGELRPYLLNKDIQFLNHSMQKYIHLFFNNTDVTLKLDGSAINILVDSNGIKKSISGLSGGEKKRVDLAIQLGLYDLIQSTSQVGFNVMCLDEIESQLDELGIDQIINIIEDKSEEIDSVLWISNNSTVRGSIPKKIRCIKALGKTTMEED